MVWSVTVNQWGKVTEFDFPPALCKAQFMDGSMPRLGKLWKENVSYPACSPVSMAGTSISSDSKHNYNYSNNRLYISTHALEKGTNDFRLLILGFVASSPSSSCSAAAV